MNNVTPTPINPALAEQTVPRYTSYPTAPHFNPSVGPDVYAAWLAELPRAATLSLYLHVPYCAELCNYCGCHTKITQRRDPVESYADRLLDEIALLAKAAAGRRVVHIHWGGGTPTMLGPARLVEIAERLRDVFDLQTIREHAIELDPRRVTRPVARALEDMGVNRVSLGVQDLSPHVQQAIGRIQPFGVVSETVAMLRDAGIGAINFDLMYGLPKQTERDVRRSIALAETLSPHRIALFGYAHVPWFKANQRLIETGALPGPAERLAQAETARETLTSLGFEQIGLDHFARPDDELSVAARAGRLHRNFQGYTTDEADALLALGASAIGRLPQGFVQNAPDIGGYSRAVALGKFATVKGIAFSPDDILRGRIIERLMCDFRVDVDAVVAETGVRAEGGFAAEFDALQPLVAEGLVEVDHHRIAVRDEGRPFVRLAAAAFDAYLKTGKARHSVAV